MCICTTYVAFGPKRMLAVTPTDLLRLRPYDLSDARRLVEESNIHKDFVPYVLKAMNELNYKIAQSFAQGSIPLYLIYRSESDYEIKTKSLTLFHNNNHIVY